MSCDEIADVSAYFRSPRAHIELESEQTLVYLVWSKLADSMTSSFFTGYTSRGLLTSYSMVPEVISWLPLH